MPLPFLGGDVDKSECFYQRGWLTRANPHNISSPWGRLGGAFFSEKKPRRSCVSPLFDLDTIYMKFTHCLLRALHVVTLYQKVQT